MENEHLSDAKLIMDDITDTQADIMQLRDARATLEANLADLNQQIDDDVIKLAALQEELNRAIASATHKAVGG